MEGGSWEERLWLYLDDRAGALGVVPQGEPKEAQTGRPGPVGLRTPCVYHTRTYIYTHTHTFIVELEQQES